MRRQPLHESHGGSVMTRRPRRRAQISRCYHQLPPPQPPSPSPPLPLVEDNELLQSPENSSITSRTRSLQHCSTGSPVTGSFRNRLVTGTSHNYQAFKTSIFGRPFKLSNVLTQVGKLPVWNLLLLFLVLNLLIRPAMSKPWIDEQPNKVTFRSRICQPVSSADLRRRMGAAFDDAKMAADMTSAKNLLGDDIMSSLNKGMDGYQSDGPALSSGLQTDSSSLVQAERYLSPGETYLHEEEMTYRGNDRVEEREEVDFDFDVNNGRVEEREEIDEDVELEDDDLDIEKKTMLGKRSWLPRRRILNSHTKEGDRSSSSVYKDFQSSESDNVGRKDHNIISDSFKYMRRRRRRRSLETGGGGSSDNFRSQFEDNDRKAKKSYTRKSNRKDSSRESSKKYKGLLPLRLTLSGKLRNSRKLRKQLKKEYRQQSRKLNKPPPWQCKMENKVVLMKKDVFPPLLIDGRCGSDKCFYRLYNCEPNKYAIKLLQRDENHCNPLPVVGNTTVYEERWNIITRHITVGCNCASLVSSGKSKNRRKV